MPPDPPALIRQWLDHRDEAAARALIDHLYPLVTRIVRRHVTGRENPEDLAQETFARLFNQLARYDPTLPLENWTARLTLNVCRSYMRQRFDYPRLVPPEAIAALGPVGRRFLGFDVRMPVSLEEYYVPPEHRLYKAGQG